MDGWPQNCVYFSFIFKSVFVSARVAYFRLFLFLCFSSSHFVLVPSFH